MYHQQLADLKILGPQVTTTKDAERSTVAELGRLVEQAASQRSPLEGAVAKFAKW